MILFLSIYLAVLIIVFSFILFGASEASPDEPPTGRYAPEQAPPADGDAYPFQNENTGE